MIDSMKISVIIVCYNEIHNIKRCLNSIYAINYLQNNYEVIVIDNNSNDGTLEIIRSFAERHNNLKLFVNKHRSIAKSRNLGISKASFPFIAFTDADCQVPKNWLSVLAKGYQKYKTNYPELAAVGGTNFAPKKTHSFYDAANITLKTFLGNRGSTQGRQFHNDIRVPHIPTLNILYDKQAVNKLGNFDEAFRFVCEDPELNHRLTSSGYKIIMLKDSFVIHHFKPGYKHWVKNVFSYGMGRMQVINKHPDHFNFVYLIPPLILPIYLLSTISFYFKFHTEILLLAYTFFVFIYALYHGLKKNALHILHKIFMIYLITHLSYSAGQLYGLIKYFPSKIKTSIGW